MADEDTLETHLQSEKKVRDLALLARLFLDAFVVSNSIGVVPALLPFQDGNRKIIFNPKKILKNYLRRNWLEFYDNCKRYDLLYLLKSPQQNSLSTEPTALRSYHGVIKFDVNSSPARPLPANDLFRDETSLNPVSLPEPAPSTERDAKGPLELENVDHKTLAAHVVQREADPAFVAELKAARTAQHAFANAAKPPMPLPTVAEKLWANNTEGLTATAFVAKYYAPWIEAGVLTLKAIGECDPALSSAYSKRASRHPDEAVSLARAVHPRTIADPQAALENYRAKERERKARYRNRDIIAHKIK